MPRKHWLWVFFLGFGAGGVVAAVDHYCAERLTRHQTRTHADKPRETPPEHNQSEWSGPSGGGGTACQHNTHSMMMSLAICCTHDGRCNHHRHSRAQRNTFTHTHTRIQSQEYAKVRELAHKHSMCQFVACCCFPRAALAGSDYALKRKFMSHKPTSRPWLLSSSSCTSPLRSVFCVRCVAVARQAIDRPGWLLAWQPGENSATRRRR